MTKDFKKRLTAINDELGKLIQASASRAKKLRKDTEALTEEFDELRASDKPYTEASREFIDRIDALAKELEELRDLMPILLRSKRDILQYL